MSQSDILKVISRINELTGDSAISSPANLDVLQYLTATGKWTNLTIAGAGISATGHAHAATDITSATLPVARGGTGNVNYTNAKFLTYASAQSVFGSSSYGTADAANWDTAYGWGNHAGLYLAIAGTAADSSKLNGQSASYYQTADANLTSLSALSYVSGSFVKMTAAGTFALDTATYLTTLAHNSTTSIQGGTTNEYYHLTSARHTKLTAWMTSVTLGATGDLTLPTGANLVITNKVRWNTATSALEFYNGADSWFDVELSRKGANILGTADAFTASSLTTTSSTITGANSTSAGLGNVAGYLSIIHPTSSVYARLVLSSGGTVSTAMAFKLDDAVFDLHPGGGYPVSVFRVSTVGINQPFRVYGYPTGAAGAVPHYGSIQIVHPAAVDLCQFSTDCAGGFDFDAKAVSNIATLAITTSGTINSSAILTAAGVADTPNDGDTTIPISSNWAYDHAAKAHGYTMYFTANQFNPADATTYYIGFHQSLTPQTSETVLNDFIPQTGTITAAHIWTYAATAAGSDEPWVFNVCVNGAPTAIASVELATNSRKWNNTAMSVAVTKDQTISISTTTPTWATDVVGLRISGYIFIE